MKKILLFTAALTCVLFISLPALSQSDKTTGTDKKAIPADIMKVFDKSCAACHKEPGKKMALGPLNLSGWDKYAPEKQAAKANAICNMITKEKMPPKGFKTSNPGAIPTADDLKLICNWAASLQPKEK